MEKIVNAILKQVQNLYSLPLRKDINPIFFENASYQFLRVLENTLHSLETIYFNQILKPELERIFKYEKETYYKCIYCIIHCITKEAIN